MQVKTKRCQHGVFSFFADDMYVGKSLDAYGNYSEDEVEVFKQVLTPDDIAIEVGSNIGAHTVPMSRLCKWVYAFEPQPENYKLLEKNLTANKCDNVLVWTFPVGSEHVFVNIPTLEELGHSNYGQVEVGSGSYSVTQVTLDDTVLTEEKIKFIKIDCEGMELEVLKGAEQLIARWRPIIYLENDRAEKSSALTGWLIDHGYRCYWHKPPLFYKDNPNGNKNNVFGCYVVSINMLCTPEEANIELTGMEEAFDTRIDPDMYDRESKHWLRKAEKNPDDLELSFRAAHFFNLDCNEAKARELIAANLAKDPNHFGTLHLKGLLDLQAGDFINGWPAYEYRYKMKNTAGFGYREHDAPHWDGQPTDKPVLIWGEQGFGDNIMFARFMDEVLRRAPNAFLECPSQLYELFEHSALVPKDRLFRIGRMLPSYSYHCSLPSLPFTLGLSTENQVRRDAYLFADPKMIQSWRSGGYPSSAADPRLVDIRDRQAPISIGLCHRGGFASERAYSRDIPKDLVEPLAVRFGPFMDLVQAGQFDGYADTAAAISSLDLVITVDTSVAHLSGALGIETWLLLSSDPDWRWQRGRSDSPWYPSMRIFRQDKFMDWSNVLDDILDELERRKYQEAAE